MDRPSIHGQSGFFERLRQSGMSMTDAGEIFAARAERHGSGSFGDQFSRARADDVNAQNPVCFFMRQNLYFAFHLAEG